MIQNADNWVPVNLIRSDDYTPVTGVTYNDPGLSVHFRQNGAAPQVKVLALADWSEGVDGGYSIRATALECPDLGQFDYWVSYPGVTTYYGSLPVEAAPVAPGDPPTVGEIRSEMETADGALLPQIQTAVEGIDIAPVVNVSVDTTEFDAAVADINAKIAGAGTGSVDWAHVVTVDGLLREGATVSYFTDAMRLDLAATGVTGSFGNVIFHLDPGTYYAKVYVPGFAIVESVEVVA